MTDVSPTETSSRDGTTFTHRAFGQISASRVTSSGGRALYGSDFRHSAFITLRISRSCFDRYLSRDWYHEREQLIEVDLSEAQWATFVSSLNVGGGVPCTLNRVVGEEPIPGIVHRPQTSHFRTETREVVESAIGEVESALAEVESSNLSASKRKTIGDRLRAAAQHLRSNLPFVSRSFDEHVEKQVERAKVEVNAYATSQLLSIGLATVAPPSPIAMIEDER